MMHGDFLQAAIASGIFRSKQLRQNMDCIRKQ